MHDMEIEYIPSYAFHDVSLSDDLHLQGNMIDYIQPNAFSDVTVADRV